MFPGLYGSSFSRDFRLTRNRGVRWNFRAAPAPRFPAVPGKVGNPFKITAQDARFGRQRLEPAQAGKLLPGLGQHLFSGLFILNRLFHLGKLIRRLFLAKLLVDLLELLMQDKLPVVLVHPALDLAGNILLNPQNLVLQLQRFQQNGQPLRIIPVIQQSGLLLGLDQKRVGNKIAQPLGIVRLFHSGERFRTDLPGKLGVLGKRLLHRAHKGQLFRRRFAPVPGGGSKKRGARQGIAVFPAQRRNLSPEFAVQHHTVTGIRQMEVLDNTHKRPQTVNILGGRHVLGQIRLRLDGNGKQPHVPVQRRFHSGNPGLVGNVNRNDSLGKQHNIPQGQQRKIAGRLSGKRGNKLCDAALFRRDGNRSSPFHGVRVA